MALYQLRSYFLVRGSFFRQGECMKISRINDFAMVVVLSTTERERCDAFKPHSPGVKQDVDHGLNLTRNGYESVDIRREVNIPGVWRNGMGAKKSRQRDDANTFGSEILLYPVP